ncbi:MAG TPA: SDR family NAD(P)-dependent oxidoreductase [Candidatus Binatia bacterium]
MLNNKVAIVTGGTTRIGKAISLSLAKSGARVAICSRGRPHLDAAATEFKTAGLPVLPLQVDVCNKKQIQRAVAEVMATWLPCTFQFSTPPFHYSMICKVLGAQQRYAAQSRRE